MKIKFRHIMFILINLISLVGIILALINKRFDTIAPALMASATSFFWAFD